MSPYQNVERSFPRFERDHLRVMTFGSPALGGRRGDVTVFVPPGGAWQHDLPLVVLLHGVYGSHWSWALNGGAHVTARQMIETGQICPIVLAMPSDGLWGQGTAYLPLVSGDYERWIIDDVVGCVIENVRGLGPDSKLFLAGLSMGGYGAMRLGAKYARGVGVPRPVAGISAHSAPSHVAQMTAFDDNPLDLPPGTAPEELDALHWMRRNREHLPPLRFDCGREDKFIAANRALHDQLVSDCIAHEFAEFDGGHTWAYWETHLRDTLLFFDRIVRGASAFAPDVRA